MILRVLAAFLLSFALLLNTDSFAQRRDDSLERLGLMRLRFENFDTVENPITKKRELVFHILFIDLVIPKQPLVLRQGDQVAGYTIGAFHNREPKQLPCDRIVPGTLPTLEIIHQATGEKHIVELHGTKTVPRDR